MKCSAEVEDDSEEENPTECEGGEDYVDQSLDELDPSTVLVRVQEMSPLQKETSSSCDDGPNADKGSASSGDEEDCDDEEDSDDGGWITPNNIKQVKKQMNAEFEEEKQVTVACITTDFAMQVCFLTI